MRFRASMQVTVGSYALPTEQGRVARRSLPSRCNLFSPWIIAMCHDLVVDMRWVSSQLGATSQATHLSHSLAFMSHNLATLSILSHLMLMGPGEHPCGLEDRPTWTIEEHVTLRHPPQNASTSSLSYGYELSPLWCNTQASQGESRCMSC